MKDKNQLKHIDQRGLIFDSYRIEGIDAGQCRSVFLDWVLGAVDTPPQVDQITELLAHYGAENPEHPMTAVLREGLAGQAMPKGRRGGWRSRPR